MYRFFDSSVFRWISRLSFFLLSFRFLVHLAGFGTLSPLERSVDIKETFDKLHFPYFVLPLCLATFVEVLSFSPGFFQFFFHVCLRSLHLLTVHGPLNVPCSSFAFHHCFSTALVA